MKKEAVSEDSKAHQSPDERAAMIVIINPASGSMDDEMAESLRAGLEERGVAFEVRETTPDCGADQLASQAVEEGACEVLVCGGDGTVMAAVNGLAKRDAAKDDPEATPNVTLAIVPGGTANLLAGALKISTDIEEALEVAVNGEERVIDLGQCGDYLFALGLGLGLTEKLVSQASAKEKERIGKLAYAHAMMRELGAKPHSFRFKLDGKKERRRKGVAIVVANAGEIGGGISFAPDARMDDGLLDLCILHRFYVRDVVRMAWHSLTGNLRRDRAVSFYQAQRLEIWSDPPLDLQIDGEEVDQMVPLVVEVLPRALRVRVPADSIEPFQKV